MRTRPIDSALDDFEGTRPAANRDYWSVVVRRRWSLTLPFLLLGLTGIAVAYLWPPLYKSEALILVEQQSVPEQYVTSNVMADLQFRLDSMTQDILSRTRLSELISGFGLYTRERSRMTADEIIDHMRKHINVDLVQAPGRKGELTAFRISYLADDPRNAQKIVAQLTSLFIDKNLSTRTQQSTSTTLFLETELKQAHQSLLEQEKRLREYKMRFLGELPQQEQSNLQILGSLQSQLQLTGATLDRAEQQKVYLESLRAEYLNTREMLAKREPLASANPVIASAEARLHHQRTLLAEMRPKYTPQHPDIAALEKEVTASEALVTSLQEAEAAKKSARSGQPTTGLVEEKGLAEIESRLKAVAMEIAKAKSDTEQLRVRIQEYQRRVNMTPVREQGLAEVIRNYENSKAQYQSLLQKKLGSELATNLETRQQGEKLRALDTASLPEKPSEPNRLFIVLSGWVLGICAGIGLSTAREIKDTSVRSEADLAIDPAPFLVRIPVLRSAREAARRKWRVGIETACIALVVLLSVATSVQTYLAG
jgi:polysaccharide biosynthesis transport protein